MMGFRERGGSTIGDAYTFIRWIENLFHSLRHQEIVLLEDGARLPNPRWPIIISLFPLNANVRPSVC